MNWARVRSERIIRERGAETISLTDRTTTSSGRPMPQPSLAAKAPTPSAKKRYAPVGKTLGRMRLKKKLGLPTATIMNATHRLECFPKKVKREDIETARAAIIEAERDKARRRAEREAKRAERIAKRPKPKWKQQLASRGGHRRSSLVPDKHSVAAPSAPNGNTSERRVLQHIGKRTRSVIVEIPAPKKKRANG